MIDELEDNMKNFDKAYENDDIHHEYLAFSQFIQNIFISEDGYIIDTGNFQAVNRELMYRVVSRIKKHPIIWKLFFMI